MSPLELELQAHVNLNSVFCKSESAPLSLLSPRSLGFVVEMKVLVPLPPRFILDIEGELFYIRNRGL